MALAVTVESIDARFCKLMDEFEDHWEKVQASKPEATDKLVGLALWQTQKIAGLQEICLELARHIVCLSELVLEESDPILDLIRDAQSGQGGTIDADWFEALARE